MDSFLASKPSGYNTPGGGGCVYPIPRRNGRGAAPVFWRRFPTNRNAVQVTTFPHYSALGRRPSERPVRLCGGAGERRPRAAGGADAGGRAPNREPICWVESARTCAWMWTGDCRTPRISVALTPRPPAAGASTTESLSARSTRLHNVPGSEPLYRLITTILDPLQAPAKRLAALYHERWKSRTRWTN